MSLMHSLLAGYLRVAGRLQDANEVEAAASADKSRPAPPPTDELPPAPPLEPAPAALVIHGDERDAMSDHAAPAAEASVDASSSAGAESANEPARSHTASAEAGGSSMSASGGAGSGGTGTSSEEGADKEAKLEHAHEPIEPPQQQTNLQDDPLSGIYSERMRQRIESDAFRTSSGDAQDSAIASVADRLLPQELRSVLNRDVPPIDISAAARAERIEALGGEIPRWARGDMESDPAVIRAMSTAAARDSNSTSDLASRLDANGVRLREPTDTPAAASPAAIAQRIPQRSIQEPAQEAAQLPKQLPRAAGGRDLER